jgi:hypothetical protein
MPPAVRSRFVDSIVWLAIGPSDVSVTQKLPRQRRRCKSSAVAAQSVWHRPTDKCGGGFVRASNRPEVRCQNCRVGFPALVPAAAACILEPYLSRFLRQHRWPRQPRASGPEVAICVCTDVSAGLESNYYLRSGVLYPVNQPARCNKKQLVAARNPHWQRQQ